MRHAPRILILAIDLMISVCAIIVAFLIRFDFSLPDQIWGQGIRAMLLIVLPIRAIVFLVFKTYQGAVRYTTTRDAERIILAMAVSTVLVLLVNQWFIARGEFLIPRSVIVIEGVGTTLAMIAARIFVRSIFTRIQHEGGAEPVAIFGPEQQAIQLKRMLEHDTSQSFRVVAFFKPESTLRHTTIESVPVYALHRLETLLEEGLAKKLIIAHATIEDKLRQRVIDICLRKKVTVLLSPDLSDWVNQKSKPSRQLKKLNINDLLMRPPIVLSTDAIEEYLTGKVVLVTGAAGSIGSEIVRQVARFKPKLIVLYDAAETPLYTIDLELREDLNFTDFTLMIGDTGDEVRLRNLFETYRPEVLFHAAAYKHVPMMEEHPYEAVHNNVGSIKIIADLALEYDVKRFVMISTDKAVNPTNVMGASKRLCEIYIQMLAQQGKTRFITTRFGNVLGSNGSVIQRFQKQIEQGGPITLTHPDIRRYFMSIPEACQLVLQAGTMGEGGEIFVFDMGKAERIRDLAEKMILLSGAVPGQDIKIVNVGLRPGEKLYEETLANEENTLPTYHQKILLAKAKEYDAQFVNEKINALLEALKTENDFQIVARMKEIIPEYKSQNSKFQSLDHD